MAGPNLWTPYCGIAPVPDALLVRWNVDPVLLAVLALAAVAIWRAGGLTARERSFGAAAVGVAFLLFVSPFCALTSALFAARSAHHVLLTAALAPLLAAAMPRDRLARLPGGLAFWLVASAVTLWLWHAPAFYAAALSSDFLYWVMQASLGGTAFAFWAAVRGSAAAPAIGVLLAYMVQMGLLGALLTFSTAAFYAPHALVTVPWGMTQLEDQQLAGLIMWVPGAAAYLAAALLLLRRLVGDAPRAVPA